MTGLRPGEGDRPGGEASGGDEGVERRRFPGVAEGKTMEVEALRREIQDLREELEKLRKRA
jgi:hypothetical protein